MQNSWPLGSSWLLSSPPKKNESFSFPWTILKPTSRLEHRKGWLKVQENSPLWLHSLFLLLPSRQSLVCNDYCEHCTSAEITLLMAGHFATKGRTRSKELIRAVMVFIRRSCHVHQIPEELGLQIPEELADGQSPSNGPWRPEPAFLQSLAASPLASDMRHEAQKCNIFSYLSIYFRKWSRFLSETSSAALHSWNRKLTSTVTKLWSSIRMSC